MNHVSTDVQAAVATVIPTNLTRFDQGFGVSPPHFNHKTCDELVERSLQQEALWDEMKEPAQEKSGTSLSGGQQQRLSMARDLARKVRKCC